MNPLKVAAIPLNITWADKDENLQNVEKAIASLPHDTDLVVLPELFNTGFLQTQESLNKHAEDAVESPSLKRVAEWAQRFNLAIAGSLVVREEDNSLRNRAFFIEPSGERTFYDKRHLFCLSSESKNLTCGTRQLPIIRYRGWNIALAVCYDLRFPAWLRNADCKYDLLIIPANWPNSRAYAWKQLLIARAIENQAYVVGANRSGIDDDGQYDNNTYIFNHVGKKLNDDSTQEQKPTHPVVAVLDGEKMQAWRERFPVWKDADNFTLNKA